MKRKIFSGLPTLGSVVIFHFNLSTMQQNPIEADDMVDSGLPAARLASIRTKVLASGGPPKVFSNDYLYVQ